MKAIWVSAVNGLGLLLVGIFIWSNQVCRAQTQVFNPRTFINPVLTNLPGADALFNQLLSVSPPAPSIPIITKQPTSLPGTYWGLQNSMPPLPYNPFPQLAVYELNATNHTYLIDDRSVDYPALNQLQAEQAQMQALQDGPIITANGPMTPLDLTTSSNLWLEIPTNGLSVSNELTVILHNTVEAQLYDMLTTEALNDPITWAMEQSVTGAVGNATSTQMIMNGRTNLFIRARTDGSTPGITILFQPLDQVVYRGDTVTFSVTASGSGVLSYQWSRDGVDIVGANASSYTIESAQTSDATSGPTGYAVTVSDGNSSVASRDAQLTVGSGISTPWIMVVQGERQDYSFKEGMTYYVGSAVQLYGTTTLKGGTVIKFDPSHSDSSLVVHGALVCDTQPYYPAILTSMNDFSVGETMNYAYAPAPAANGVAYLNLDNATNVALANLRICYADQGVTTPLASRQLDVWNCQFVQCNFGIVNLVPGFGARNTLHNVLFSYCGAAIGAVSNAVEIEAEQMTADVATFWLASTPPYKLALTNSIIMGALDAGATLDYSEQVVVTASNTVYQTSGYGNYYLPAGSPYHQAGSSNISQRLRTEFQGKTTYPPLRLPALYSQTGSLTLFPQVTRDTGDAPDLGYHYDALDYTVSWMTVQGAVTVEPGTAIAVCNEYAPALNGFTFLGFDLREGSSFVCRGTPARPNVLTAAKLVQETPPLDYGVFQITTYFDRNIWLPCSVALNPDFIPNDVSAPAPIMDFRFTRFFQPASDYHLWSGMDEFGAQEMSYDSSMYLNLQDCQLRGGRFNVGNPDYYYYAPGQVYAPGAISLVNNCFENVNINLDPTYYEYGYGVNSDMQVQARNNLFRGGWWLHLEPIPATAGNWVFKDNLFDRVDVVQNTSQPLDYDNNAYWPLSAGALAWDWNAYPWYVTNSIQLQPTPTGQNGSHELVLSSAPPYQTGPLGDFYLPNTTPLYGAGSTNAGALGLAQYTTNPDQTKEGATHIVNIGLHYVAANTFSQPLDSDGDGIPDYMEDANGNGLLDGVETSPTNTITDGVTNDIYNVAYDDVDLSGNGLVGRIKKALGLNPLDAINPFTLTQVITGEEPDIATFKMPINYDTMTNIGKLNLLVNGNSGTFMGYESDTNGQCLLSWNTTFNPPGYQALQVQFTLKGQLHMGNIPDPTVLVGMGQFTPFYSSNVCQFNPFYAEYDTNRGAILYATTPACPDVDYSIEIQTLAGEHIKTITNNISTGIISEHWDLTDDNNNIITNEMVKAVFNVTLLDPASGTHTLYMSSKNDLYSQPDGAFTVAYAWDNDNEAAGDLRDCIQWAVVDPMIKTCNAGFCFDHPYNSTFNTYSDPPATRGNPGHLSNNDDVNRLLGNLSNTNLLAEPTLNFFYYGHGNGAALLDGKTPNQANLDYTQVADALGNRNFTFGKLRKIKLRGWAYRFVFLDACATADESDWAHCFGVFDRIKSADLANWPEKVQAFVGWNGEQKVPGTGDLLDMSEALMVFSSAWQSGLSLDDCIYYASQEYPPAPLNGFHLVWNFGPVCQHYNFLERRKHGVTKDPRLVIYGYAGITRTGYQLGHDQSPYYKTKP